MIIAYLGYDEDSRAAYQVAINVESGLRAELVHKTFVRQDVTPLVSNRKLESLQFMALRLLATFCRYWG